MHIGLTKALVAYSAVTSTALLAIVLMGARRPDPQTLNRFDQIEVQRINVVEPDGTLRMVLSNSHDLPPVLIKGQPQPRGSDPRPQAGMLFYNDEGSENGGLIFGGHKNAQGQIVDSGGSLSFDKYGAGQIVQLAGVADSTDHFAGMRISDGKRRVWVGQDAAGAASVSLAPMATSAWSSESRRMDRPASPSSARTESYCRNSLPRQRADSVRSQRTPLARPPSPSQTRAESV